MTKQVLALTLAMTWVGAATSFAAPQTWTGKISDIQCGANHGGEVEERDCTLECARLGVDYAFVTAGKVLKIANQKFAALPQQAGRIVRLTGELKGDTITVTKIEAAPAAK